MPSKAKACPCCGADDRTGLHAGLDSYDAEDLPFDPAEFDYNEFMKREFGSSAQRVGLHWVWWVTGLLLVAAFLIIAIGSH